jgi:hypothetical protein
MFHDLVYERNSASLTTEDLDVSVLDLLAGLSQYPEPLRVHKITLQEKSLHNQYVRRKVSLTTHFAEASPKHACQKSPST